MPKTWVGTHPEAEVIRATVDGAQGDPLERRKWNVEGTIEGPSADGFWKWLVLSLLSSQQPYREGSAVWRLENSIDKFPLPLSEFASLDESEIDLRLRRFRFHERITEQLIANHRWLFGDRNGWKNLQSTLNDLLLQRNSPPVSTHWEMEREAAHELANNFKGVGPKQARNLLQSLGLTRYEIPLDSRVVRWLRDRLGWSISMESLARTEYYEELLDRVQASCEAAGVLPTLFDAAVFYEMGKGATVRENPTTCTGYVNRNGQVVVRNTRTPGTDKNQYVYQLACSHCGHVYGANGSDIHLRLCPVCQGGQLGLAMK
jgi:thermostable 8-oxoguanine DNA glycosylase